MYQCSEIIPPKTPMFFILKLCTIATIRDVIIDSENFCCPICTSTRINLGGNGNLFKVISYKLIFKHVTDLI